MSQKDPTIIGYCHPRDAHWLNAGLRAETAEDWERVRELREIARAQANLPAVSPGLFEFSAESAPFAGINHPSSAPWVDPGPPSLDDMANRNGASSSIVQPESASSRARSL